MSHIRFIEYSPCRLCQVTGTFRGVSTKACREHANVIVSHPVKDLQVGFHF